MKKIITVLCVALLCCMVLTACSSPVTFQTSGASYDVAEITSSNEVSGMAPGSGNTFLVVKSSVRLKTVLTTRRHRSLLPGERLPT